MSIDNPENTLDESQQRAYDRIQDWIVKGDKPTLSVGGFAGSGKSFLISKLVSPRTAVAAYTGKAVNVLAQKGVEAVTLHRLLYEFLYVIEGQPKFLARAAGELKDEWDLIIVDEASMVSSSLARDLLAHQIPVLFVGDHGQLAPVSGSGATNYVKDPEIVLETIHRQAEGSTIIDFAHHLREGHDPFRFASSSEVTVMPETELQLNHFEEADVVLVGTNARRTLVNNMLRKNPQIPYPGEPLVILRNDYTRGLFNGQIVTVVETLKILDERIWIKIHDGDQELCAPFWLAQFGNAEPFVAPTHSKALLADFGYALTCHKFQGSQADHILVFESEAKDERWRYTAATRAVKKLVYVPAGKDWAQSNSPILQQMLSREKYKPPPRFAVSSLELLKQRVRDQEG